MERLHQKRPRLALKPKEYGQLRTRVLQRDGWRCQCCGISKDLHVHHLVHRSQLGSDKSDNLIALCAGCHGPAAHARKDRKQFHATRHGVHSRRLYEALAKHGENVRELRRIELALRKTLQPTGILAEILFDRMWACFLRCLLITLAEKDLFAAGNLAANFEERLKQANTMALATGSSKVDGGGLLNGLSVLQRYDSHHWREFNKALGMLLELRKAGNDGLMRLLRDK